MQGAREITEMSKWMFFLTLWDEDVNQLWTLWCSLSCPDNHHILCCPQRDWNLDSSIHNCFLSVVIQNSKDFCWAFEDTSQQTWCQRNIRTWCYVCLWLFTWTIDPSSQKLPWVCINKPDISIKMSKELYFKDYSYFALQFFHQSYWKMSVDFFITTCALFFCHSRWMLVSILMTLWAMLSPRLETKHKRLGIQDGVVKEDSFPGLMIETKMFERRFVRNVTNFRLIATRASATLQDLGTFGQMFKYLDERKQQKNIYFFAEHWTSAW